jgi:hypothetical protein
MRVQLLFGIAILGSAVGAQAQVPGVKEETPFRPSPSSNFWLEVVRNEGSSPLEAFFSSFSCSNSGGLRGSHLILASTIPGTGLFLPPEV